MKLSKQKADVTAALSRGGHVNSLEELRRLKAEKARRILSHRRALGQSAVLDLGAGSGLLMRCLQPYCRSIAAADRDTAPFAVTGVAIERIEGVTLPFDSGSFDVVVYNHVIEHVGDRALQHRALQEIRRVLAPGGHHYLAVPNRWALVEPHYRLPLLSWLPQRGRRLCATLPPWAMVRLQPARPQQAAAPQARRRRTPRWRRSAKSSTSKCAQAGNGP